jgi:hypothetical protein
MNGAEGLGVDDGDTVGVTLLLKEMVGVTDSLVLADAPADKDTVGEGVIDEDTDELSEIVGVTLGVREIDGGILVSFKASTATLPVPPGCCTTTVSVLSPAKLKIPRKI